MSQKNKQNISEIVSFSTKRTRNKGEPAGGEEPLRRQGAVSAHERPRESTPRAREKWCVRLWTRESHFCSRRSDTFFSLRWWKSSWARPSSETGPGSARWRLGGLGVGAGAGGLVQPVTWAPPETPSQPQLQQWPSSPTSLSLLFRSTFSPFSLSFSLSISVPPACRHVTCLRAENVT